MENRETHSLMNFRAVLLTRLAFGLLSCSFIRASEIEKTTFDTETFCSNNPNRKKDIPSLRNSLEPLLAQEVRVWYF